MSNKRNIAISNRNSRLESPLDSLSWIIHRSELILEKLLELQKLYEKHNYPKEKKKRYSNRNRLCKAAIHHNNGQWNRTFF